MSHNAVAGTNKGELDFLFANKEASASEHSISSMVSSISASQDENFRMTKHAENSLKVMEKYLHDQQLTDVILIAGKWCCARVLCFRVDHCRSINGTFMPLIETKDL